MGITDSTQKLGERVVVAKRKLKQNKEIQLERYEYLKANSPDILIIAMESIEESFKSYSPFLEATLLLAWIHDSETCKNIVLTACRKVLSAPISKTQYLWFKQYVFDSSLWFFKYRHKYMFEELLNIAKEMSSDIIDSMDLIYNHLQTHNKWQQITNIKDSSIVSRQDDKKVGLFKNKGFKDLFESKNDDEKYEDMKSFVDSNLAVNILTSTATNINKEFQNHVKTVMSHYGEVKPGPTKKVERCVSKLENDYQNEQYPKCAKLLDLVRCSVTFNTVDQLIKGYNALIKHISKHENVIELARIKNGFLDPKHKGYRDIKLNVIYKSDINPGLNMICEIQLLIINYLQEKKRIHKLYTIVREELYFQMVTKQQVNQSKKTKDIKDLEFVRLLDCRQKILPNETFYVSKASVDPELDLLGVEACRWFGCVDMKKSTVIFEQKTTVQMRHSHNWFSKNQQKYLSLQTAPNTIKIFEVNEGCKFKENESLNITLPNNARIYYSEFDRNFDNILMVYNSDILQKRSFLNSDQVVNIKLDQKLNAMIYKQLAISDDGNLCCIAGGTGSRMFYLIDIVKNKQHKLKSNVLKHSFAPCFINGQTQNIAIGGKGNLEIWDIAKQIGFKKISVDDCGESGHITCAVSINNILGIGSQDKTLRLFDVRSWDLFYSQKYIEPLSLHLTEDLKYITIGGQGGDRCIVLQIK